METKKHGTNGMKPLRLGALPEQLRQLIIQTRKARKLSQRQLGEQIGLSQKHISEIENGKISPRYDTVLEVLRVLGLDLVPVPSNLVPVVKSLTRDYANQTDDQDDERPLYASTNDRDDHDDDGEVR